jgi:ubiquinone biosynthesis protein
VSGLLKLLKVGRVLVRHRLDLLLRGTALGRGLWLLRPFTLLAGDAERPRGERLRLALQELGPLFVKFGQILSTRRDLLPPDVADELALLQDRVAPFPGAQARQRVEAALGRRIDAVYAEFDETPLASASIAQVHAARLHDGRAVAVKVLRPAIAERVESDLSLLRLIAGLVERWHPNADKLQPRAMVAEIEATLRAELDLQREGANASVLRRNWLHSSELQVPMPLWECSAESVLTLERVDGIPIDDLEALDAAGIDRGRLAAQLVRVFYTQVFRDNFFHADAHAGNLWVDRERRDPPRLIALDFGIVGQLPPRDQYYLAENFMAMFTRDYRRIAQLHVDAGWMPATVRIEELEGAVRSICEPYFSRPLSEISLGEVLAKLFRMAQRYQLTLQPQLILLQKTLLNIEGVARQLDPKLDVWAVAHPVLEAILRERYGLPQVLAELRKRLPELATQAPDMPLLLRQWLLQQVEGGHSLDMRSQALDELARLAREGQHRNRWLLLALGAGLGAVALHAQRIGEPAWQGFTWPTLATAAVAVACFAWSLRGR